MILYYAIGVSFAVFISGFFIFTNNLTKKAALNGSL